MYSVKKLNVFAECLLCYFDRWGFYSRKVRQQRPWNSLTAVVFINANIHINVFTYKMKKNMVYKYMTRQFLFHIYTIYTQSLQKNDQKEAFVLQTPHVNGTSRLKQ